MNFGEVGNFSGRFDLHDVAETNSKIFSDGLIHSDFAVFEFGIDEADSDGLFALLSFDHDGVSLEEFEFCHLGVADLDGRVLIIDGVFNLGYGIGTISLLGAFFWSRMAVDTSFLGSMQFKKYDLIQNNPFICIIHSF